MHYTENMILVTGQSKPVKEDVITSTYPVFSVCLIVDKETDRIVDAGCTTAMDETREFVRQMLCGKNLVTDLERMRSEIKSRFFALLQKALVVAVKDAQNRYFVEFPEKRLKER